MAVQAKDLFQELLAEAVHHRHHDDERGDAQEYADERETGDDRDEPFLAPRAQITQRQHPLEAAEGPRAGRFAHRCSKGPDSEARCPLTRTSESKGLTSTSTGPVPFFRSGR